MTEIEKRLERRIENLEERIKILEKRMDLHVHRANREYVLTTRAIIQEDG